jgi:hypothetical protein
VPAADILLLTPGLSVISDTIKESRAFFQPMNNYAIYRLAAYRAFDAIFALDEARWLAGKMIAGTGFVLDRFGEGYQTIGHAIAGLGKQREQAPAH